MNNTKKTIDERTPRASGKTSEVVASNTASATLAQNRQVSKPSQPIVTRIAPSPTGDPHVGTAYQSLFDYVAARQAGGRFIFRLEDTDQNRYNPESEAKLLSMLDWLGLRPDESPLKGGPHAPYRQSERLDIYKRYAEQLLAEGKAYRAFESTEELEEIRKDLQRRGLSYGYDGRARALSPAESEARAAQGNPYVIRFKSPQDGETAFTDTLRGTISVPNKEVQDVVLLKSDGFPTYHLAVVVDDHLMGVTHVIRGEEWIPTAPIHVLLHRSFGWQEPTWVHMPLLRNTSLKKLSKRHDDTSVASYRQQGIVPEALLNYLGTMGWSMPDGREFFSLEEMVRHFSFARLSPGAPIFDFKRLRHYNAKYIREILPLETVGERVKPFLAAAGLSYPSDDYVLDVLDVMLERIETLAEFPEKAAYFFTEQFSYDEQGRKKLEGGQVHLEGLERELALLDSHSYDYDTVNDAIRSYVKSQGARMPDVMQPLRAALTGSLSSPDIADVVSILGRKRVLQRIGRALTSITQGLPDDKPEKPQKDEEAKSKEKTEKGRDA